MEGWQPLTWSREGAQHKHVQSLIRKGLPVHFHCVASRGSSVEANRQIYRLKQEYIPKKPFNHQEEFGRQAGLCEAIEFLIPEDNQAGPGGLEERMKRGLTAPNRSLMRYWDWGAMTQDHLSPRLFLAFPGQMIHTHSLHSVALVTLTVAIFTQQSSASFLTHCNGSCSGVGNVSPAARSQSAIQSSQWRCSVMGIDQFMPMGNPLTLLMSFLSSKLRGLNLMS